MSKGFRSTTGKAIGNYVGETSKQIRNGFGVYNYPNKFFRYEGEWRKGKKHGHGRLVMVDGSYYEGSFKNGEISGHGYRSWSYSGNVYIGEFKCGEICGIGVMTYGNGEKYEGGWKDNKRHGEGELVEANGDIYKGSFYQHKKHGKGHQIYSNGDEYEGDWVQGLKQGHGIIKYSDGTIYNGQWRNNMFNGEGSILHVSGVKYEGMWISGSPAVESSILVCESNVIEIEQGQCFDLDVICQTVDGKAVNDEGRLLQVTAGVKILNKRSEGKFSDEEIITTPFDFEAESYPLTEMLPDSESFVNGKIEEVSLTIETEDKNVEIDRLTLEDTSKNNSSRTASAVSHLTQESVLQHSSLADYGASPEDNPDSHASQPQKWKRVIKKGSAQNSTTEVSDYKEGKRRKEKKEEKLNDDKWKYCKPGDYVIIIQEITNPPFFDTTLQPAYCHVKVTSKQKRAKSKMDKK
ncbi:MORN repeat-containing protein 1-like isoform X2 [Xenia sp. Carnegie-2017]|uniref:MORN repeat-containing protein 1-like isoform X2 n=1 Tax=Xenia sp. Carnegie-2017 TaxID=2897299 RepID=UPI001F0348AA|nr:MORN repeat-containing protein 1-like isoform X2 [Xenia sp. Carnegie-2017]